MLFVPQNMVVPQQALLKQAGVQVLAFEANSLRALTQRVQQTAAVLGPDAQQKALAYQRYFDRNVAPGHRAPERSSCVTARVALSQYGQSADHHR